MHPCFGGLARDRHLLVAGSRDLVVGGYRELQDHMGTLVADAPEMPGVMVCRLRSPEPDIDRNPRGAQSCVPLPGYLRIGILDRGHHAGDARGDDGVGAGWRP